MHKELELYRLCLSPLNPISTTSYLYNAPVGVDLSWRRDEMDKKWRAIQQRDRGLYLDSVRRWRGMPGVWMCLVDGHATMSNSDRLIYPNVAKDLLWAVPRHRLPFTCFWHSIDVNLDLIYLHQRLRTPRLFARRWGLSKKRWHSRRIYKKK